MFDSKVPVPLTVRLLSSERIHSGCYSALFNDYGTLLMGSENGIWEYKPYGNNHYLLNTNSQAVTSIARLPYKCMMKLDELCMIYGLRDEPKKKSVFQAAFGEEGDDDFFTRKCLFSYTDVTNHAKFIAASSKYAAATNTSSIELHYIDKKNHVSHSLAHSVVQLHF